MQLGEHVVVPDDSVKGGRLVGHFLGEHEVNGETKGRVQIDGSDVRDLAHRAPSDYDAAGGGGTYHRVGEK